MATTVSPDLAPFKNEALRSFDDPRDRASLEAALGRARAAFGRRYPLVIDGERIWREPVTCSINPAHPNEIVGEVATATLDDASRALDAATKRFASWSKTSALERAAFLLRAAEAIRARRDDFNALLVLEVGKTWIEADADTAEAIDFLEFYAREAIRITDPPALASMAGERNQMTYIPLGVGAIIPPWNFALAIVVGMTSAAVVSGNTTCLKPSPDSSVIAAVFVGLMHDIGLPPGVINLVPGDGATIGEYLVMDPRTRFISFTGSKAVGLRINELAAKTPPGQRWIKRVIAEMGGKDAIIVAADADLDAAVEGVAAAAYGFSGQKCSACSRAIVDAQIYDRFVDALTKKVQTLVVGDPALPQTEVGPVINQKAAEKIVGYIETGKQEGRLVIGGSRLPTDGYFIEPTVFADVLARSKIAQEEVFGPVLAIIKAKDFDDALAIANDTEFGLTGAVYSGDDAKLERARDEFHVGNLYLNRKCTGAMVGVHPFGGFNLSGTDSKAGGPDYLQLLMQAKSVSQKV